MSSDPLRRHVLEACAGAYAFVEELQAGPRAGLEQVMVSGWVGSGPCPGAWEANEVGPPTAAASRPRVCTHRLADCQEYPGGPRAL